MKAACVEGPELRAAAGSSGEATQQFPGTPGPGDGDSCGALSREPGESCREPRAMLAWFLDKFPGS